MCRSDQCQLYDPLNQCYLLVLRKDKPMQDILWLVGGRLHKGESFFECAIRKCKEEVGIAIEPVCIIDVYSTVFDNSAWDTQTHTINITILAKTTSHNTPHLNNHHTDYHWVPFDRVPGHPYLDAIYQRIVAQNLFNS